MTTSIQSVEIFGEQPISSVEIPREQPIAIVEVATMVVQSIGSGGVTDGNKGDITVSGGGTVWTINTLLKSNTATQFYLSGAALSALRLVTLNTSNQLVYADSSTDIAVMGLTFQAVSIGVAPLVILSGIVSDPSWNWTRGAPLYLGSNGQITTSIPSSGFIVRIGSATAPTVIDLNILQGVQIS